MSKHPIIAQGELYAEPVARPIAFGGKTLPHEYDAAKQRVLNNLYELETKLVESDEVFLEEKIVCVRLEPKFEAKSYIPATLVGAMSADAKIVGGRKYAIFEGREEQLAKLYFIRTTTAGIRQFRSIIEQGTRDNVKQWRQELQSVYSVDLLTSDEKVMGFSEDWESGTVEFVLHPIPGNTEEEIRGFLKLSGIAASDIRLKTYDDGITFISATCSSENIKQVKRYNPLRAVHPLGAIEMTRAQKMVGSSCPVASPRKFTPSVRVGVFDGGVDDQIPVLKKYVTAIDGASEPAVTEGIEHGSGVCSAILYGNLVGLSAADTLEPPCVAIDCYRVLPLKDRRDFDLYEIIDLIEDVVPKKTDTRLYNLSLGPAGAIVDDSISRFTYALDKLSYEVPDNVEHPLFVVAVGNDGTLPAGFNRIQAPSDIVNGLGVGAYTFDAGHLKVPAGYSCVGPGREGAKTKPDLLDFGGDIGSPFVIPSTDYTGLAAVAGTSFSAPMVTGKIGHLLAMSDKISPHMGRALLIHKAVPDMTFPKNQQGFGFCPENMKDVLECDDNNVTIMYSGKIMPTQYLSLPIFAPHINEMQGLVIVSWTVALVVDPNSNDPDAYTNNCIEDVFCPHSMTYNFSKKRCATKKLNLLKESDLKCAKELINAGYRQSSVPVSHPAKKVWHEEDLRTTELKWDTVIRKSVQMRSSSLFSPVLTLHAMGRNGFEGKGMKYQVVVSINAPKYRGSLYDAVLQTYTNLIPIEIRNIPRIIVE